MLASQLPTLDELLPVVGWFGLVLVGFSVLMTLLDWGDLSGLTSQPPPRRRPALALGCAGAVLMAVGGFGALAVG